MSARPPVAFDWLNGDVYELRARYEQAFRIAESETCRWESIEHQGQSLQLLIHRPSRPQAWDCCIVYFHGGGWIAGSPATHADISRALCELTGLRVVSVGYRLAPEHPAPAPVEDGAAVLSHLLSRSRAAGGCTHVVLCGDSSGAAIAMAVERNVDSGIRDRILGVCSLYGCFGVLDSPSLTLWGSREEGLDGDCVRRFWALANAPGTSSPYAIQSLAGPSIVPAYLLAGGRDPLRDDTLALAIALDASGRKTVVDIVESETHGFLHKVDESASASSALLRIASWINILRSTQSEPQ